jgi:hypothetical protein
MTLRLMTGRPMVVEVVHDAGLLGATGAGSERECHHQRLTIGSSDRGAASSLGQGGGR